MSSEDKFLRLTEQYVILSCRQYTSTNKQGLIKAISDLESSCSSDLDLHVPLCWAADLT